MPILENSRAGRRPRDERDRGFTLVELLVVIAIIGLIAGIAVPVVMQSLTKARNAAIKAEIDMLHMAIMNYKNEYGSFPPAAETPGNNGEIHKHLRRLFPRIAPANLPNLTYLNLIKPDSSLVFWLGGFTDDPTDPLAITNTSLKRKKLFDFDQSRIRSNQYAPREKPGSPYIYIPASQYAAATSPNPPMTFTGLTGSYAPEKDSTGAFFNADTFQILCAGRDEVFGTGDDLSNFWSGTRQDYKDGVK